MRVISICVCSAITSQAFWRLASDIGLLSKKLPRGVRAIHFIAQVALPIACSQSVIVEYPRYEEKLRIKHHALALSSQGRSGCITERLG
jgi:hypothetical protein